MKESTKLHWYKIIIAQQYAYVALWDHESTQFECYLGPSPRDWSTLIHFNVVLTVINIDHISHGVCQTVRTSFWCIIVLQSQEKVMKRHITMGQIWGRFSGPSPRNWTTTIHWNVVRTVLHTPWDMWSMWKTGGTTLKCINGLQSREEGNK